MGMQTLAQEIGIALMGSVGVWAVQAFTPLQDQFKVVLQGALVLVTLAVMARFGGLF